MNGSSGQRQKPNKMKKKIEAELNLIAKEILADNGKIDTGELKRRVGILYDKLTVLAFTEENLSKLEYSSKAEKREVKSNIPSPSHDEFYPDGTEYNADSDEITEPNTEKIKDIVAQMPPESEKVDSLMDSLNTVPQTQKPKQEKRKQDKKDFRNIGVDYDNLPNFEPVNHVEKNNKPRSLNDRLKKGINIGLNDRLAYIRHLFDGNTADYNRVLSQLNTFSSFEEASNFIEKVVKPDYNNWEGKEEHEEKFLTHIENKFSK